MGKSWVVYVVVGLLLGVVSAKVMAKSGTPSLTKADIENALIIDVRSPEEFARGHYPNAVNMPLDTLANAIPQLTSEKRPIVVYCRSGNRSGKAVKLLKEAGILAKNGVNQASLVKVTQE